ncbi:acyl-CoA dehydrogenase family protein [Rhodococcus sp. 1168]|uniref:acyl-CoA dehydrogenase family protein n=1 Tax=Rhodococcus sp. 1168 TaxID=2018041 RepID=UPI000A0D6F0B|nr:acyl-CoA dehydrogenase family protein [Rhodococcus sp. 1168]ORI14792.1 acyl-CoA dehydrogenase [Rhodococcus sp. 1168]
MTTIVEDRRSHPVTEELLEHYRPVFREIAAGAAEREASRTLAYDAIEALKVAGFGSLRVPTQYGGTGATLTQSLRVLRELGEADSNLVQALRAHFATVEGLVASTEEAYREKWFRRIVDGAIIGNATTERGNEPGRYSTKLVRRDGKLYLTGVKFYSTGSLYADWITVAAETEGGDTVRVSVPADAPGLERIDDWNGFGQRLTASGTTRLSDVEANSDDVAPAPQNDSASHLAAYVQLILLVALGGVARAARRDVIEFVRNRTRAYGHGVGDSPQRDPLVQEVIGRVSSSVFAVESILDATAREVERIAMADTHDTVSAGELEELNAVIAEAQITIVDLTLDVTTKLFEVGGASATSESLRLDRHWRNARVLAQHNPVIYRARAVGQQRLTGDHLTNAIYVGRSDTRI